MTVRRAPSPPSAPWSRWLAASSPGRATPHQPRGDRHRRGSHQGRPLPPLQRQAGAVRARCLAAVEDHARGRIPPTSTTLRPVGARPDGAAEFLAIARGEEYRRIVILEGPAVLGYERSASRRSSAPTGWCRTSSGACWSPTTCRSPAGGVHASVLRGDVGHGLVGGARPGPQQAADDAGAPGAGAGRDPVAARRLTSRPGPAEPGVAVRGQRWTWTDPPWAGTSSIHTLPAGSVTSSPPDLQRDGVVEAVLDPAAGDDLAVVEDLRRARARELVSGTG